MKDIELAQKILFEEELTLCVVKDSEILFKSKNKGIEPLYKICTESLGKLKGASVADRVTGKAAAMICVHIGVVELSTNVISKTAFKILNDINIKYKKIVPYILNRTKSDMCPVERLSQDIDDFDLLIKRVKDFLDNIKAFNKV